MASLQQLKNNLNVAYEHHQAQNYAVSVPICQTLLINHILPPIMAVECHIMLITAHVPDALEHSVSANIIAREFLAQYPDSETFQELYDISQNLLRAVQQQTREARDALIQQNLAFTSGFSNQPQSESLPPIDPATGHRRRVSGFRTNLATIPEEPEEEEPARRGPSRPVYRNRRPSSLSRALENLLRNMGSSEGR